MMKKGFIPFIVLIIVYASCQWNSGVKETADAPPKKPDSVRRVELVKKTFFRDSTVDFTARFIAGLPQLSRNQFSKMERMPYWISHSKKTESNWDKLEAERLDAIREWEKTFFRSKKSDTLPLFYPFSGPDFIHAATLYPNTTRYIFVALEPIVDLPDIEQLNDGNRKIFLQSIENSLRDVYNKSYFITTHMADDFKFDKAKGVLPVFYVFLARSGYEILDVETIAIDNEGNLHDTLIKAKNSKWVSGVKFSFRNPGSDTLRELFYFNADISDNGLTRKPGILSFLQEQGQFNTFVKSASYLLGYSTFSRMRRAIINNSQTIFQDDTGIPYKWIKGNPEFKTILFGEYTKPTKDFGDYVFQDDLDSVYQSKAVKEKLPFHLGYHYSDKKQSQQLYIRK